MADLLIMILIPLIGIGLYFITAFISKRKKLILLVTGLVILLIALYFYINSYFVPNESFRSLAEFVKALLVLYILAGYLVGWLIDKFVLKRT